MSKNYNPTKNISHSPVNVYNRPLLTKPWAHACHTNVKHNIVRIRRGNMHSISLKVKQRTLRSFIAWECWRKNRWQKTMAVAIVTWGLKWKKLTPRCKSPIIILELDINIYNNMASLHKHHQTFSWCYVYTFICIGQNS